MSRSEAEKILSDAQLFLRQQQELYGDLFFTPPERAADQNESQEMKSTRSTPPKNSVPQSISISDPLTMAISDEPWAATKDLPALNAQICDCQKCGLGKTRKSFVFGVGNPRAEVVVVGEAPGADEDEKGEPFVGRAGQLLTKILEAVQFKREENMR